MTAVRKKLTAILVVLVALLAGLSLFVLTGCGRDKAEDLKVTFMVQDDTTNEWQQYSQVTAENGKVTLPTVSKQYYTFANWYENEQFTGTPFTGENVTKTLNVYAKFVPVEVNVHINGVDKGTQNLVDVVKGSYNPGEGLEFDGWYTNANYTTKWDGQAETNDLYAKSVARITFNNGYEDVYTTTVNPGTVYETPVTQTAKTEAGETSTVQEVNIRKNYMSKNDISYVDENGNVFDFTKAIDKNTTITVKWRSPFLKYQKNSATGNLCVTMYGNEGRFDDTENYASINTVPVISILGKITFDNDGDGAAETYNVESIRLENGLINNASIKKLIIGEGIVTIQSINANASSVTEIVLPSTLKVIQNCFNNLNSLKSINIPDGVEVIIGSFWANTVTSWNGYAQYNKGETYSFDIAIPESVKNLSMVPSNLAFTHTKETAKTGDFYKDGNYIYQKTEKGLVLIGDYTDGTTVNVPEGVNGIQVGTYFNRTLEYLVLPETFSFVNYNEDVSNYPAAAFQYSSKTFLFDKQYANDLKGNVAPTAYAIFSAMESVTLVNFRQTAYPEGLSEYAFIGDPTGWAVLSEDYYEPCSSTSLKDKLIYSAESETPSVTVNYVNALTGETYSAVVNKAKNDTLTVGELLSALDTANKTALAKAYEKKSLSVVSVKNLGSDYDLSSALTTNVYLDITFTYSFDGGYTATDNGDGTATISGYNADTAVISGNGLAIVSVPETVTVGGKELKVTAVAANAFANNAEIGYIILPASLKTIGEKAFYNCASLVAADISACKLNAIGASAFEKTSLTEITLALSELKEIGAYAFKISTLMQFIPAAGEENRSMLTKADLKEGEFFFVIQQVVLSFTKAENRAIGIYSYVKKTVAGEGETAVTTWDVKFVASAGGYNASLTSCNINLGNIDDTSNIIRYEVMEGSYYYLGEESVIYFNSVSKIHANAFTDSETKNYSSSSFKYSPSYMGSAITGRKKLSELVNDENCSSVFEEGWYEGYTDDGMGSNIMRTV